MKATPPPAKTPSTESSDSPLWRIPALAESACCTPYELCPPPMTTCSASKLITRLSECIAPFNFNLTALAGIFLWFLLFFLLADGCRPFFARHVCEACLAGNCNCHGR